MIPFFLVAQASLVPLTPPDGPGLAGNAGFASAERFSGSPGMADYVITVSPEMVGAMGSADFLVSATVIGDGSVNPVAARVLLVPFPPSAPVTSFRLQVFDPSTGTVYSEAALLAPGGVPRLAVQLALQRKGPASVDG